MMKVNWC